LSTILRHFWAFSAIETFFDAAPSVGAALGFMGAAGFSAAAGDVVWAKAAGTKATRAKATREKAAASDGTAISSLILTSGSLRL
jgi:hypothetical protein